MAVKDHIHAIDADGNCLDRSCDYSSAPDYYASKDGPTVQLADGSFLPLGLALGQFEAVDHPQHYGGDVPYEAIKVIEAWGLGMHLGTAVKYIARAGKKDPTKEIEDLEKARWYLDRHINNLKEQAL